MYGDRGQGSSSGIAGVSPAPGSSTENLVWHSRGYLPHFDQPGVLQMITFRIADAAPQNMLQILGGRSPREETSKSRRIDELLDASHGACHLADPRIAQGVQSAFLHFDGGRYRLLAWVVMPNHVHVLVETFSDHPISSVVQSWKSFTSKQANRLLGRHGEFWYPDYFDRAIRNERHLANAVEYIHDNPVKAGLVSSAGDWRFSSARVYGARPGAGETPAIPSGGGAPRRVDR